jgi:hypothetical protein
MHHAICVYEYLKRFKYCAVLAWGGLSDVELVPPVLLFCSRWRPAGTGSSAAAESIVDAVRYGAADEEERKRRRFFLWTTCHPQARAGGEEHLLSGFLIPPSRPG